MWICVCCLRTSQSNAMGEMSMIGVGLANILLNTRLLYRGQFRTEPALLTSLLSVFLAPSAFPVPSRLLPRRQYKLVSQNVLTNVLHTRTSLFSECGGNFLLSCSGNGDRLSQESAISFDLMVLMWRWLTSHQSTKFLMTPLYSSLSLSGTHLIMAVSSENLWMSHLSVL